MKSKYFIVVLLAVIAFGCKDSSTSASNEVTGTLRGTVQLVNENGLGEHNNSGVLIQCEDFPYSTYSDSSGRWELNDLPTRTYSLSFSKTGYSTWKNTSFGFIAGGIVNYGKTTLSKPPEFTFILDALTAPSKGVWDTSLNRFDDVPGTIYGHTSANNPGKGFTAAIVFIVSRKPVMDIYDESTYRAVGVSYSTNGGMQDSILNVELQVRYYNFPELKPGDTFYVQGYPANGSGSYYDIKTDKDILFGYGQGSNVLSAVMQ